MTNVCTATSFASSHSMLAALAAAGHDLDQRHLIDTRQTEQTRAARLEEAMPLWKLTPVDLHDPNWEASSHRSVAIVRALDEADARDTAARAFDVKTRFGPRKGQRLPPWKRDALVRVERIEDARYDAEGPASVLEPTF
jgi:hypothetical protein